MEGTQATTRLGPHGTMAFDRLGGGWFLHPPPACLYDLFREEKGS